MLVALLLLAGTAHADLIVAIRNDVFTELDPPIDDVGFTNDIDVRFWRRVEEYRVGGMLVHRWITERYNALYQGRRRDLVDLLGTIERSWGEPALRELTAGLRIGPTLTGNLGGRWMQNGWHTLCHCGTTLDEGLQSTYVGDGDVGALLGVSGSGSIGTPEVQAYGVVDAQASVGTGVSFLEGAGGARVLGWIGGTQLGAHLELAVMRFHVTDDRLALPGAYRPGWQGAWRAGVHVARGRVSVGYEYRANEDGSGEPIGVLAVTIKQAGTSY